MLQEIVKKTFIGFISGFLVLVSLTAVKTNPAFAKWAGAAAGVCACCAATVVTKNKLPRI
ncbi:hypothetical protein [Nodularia spumigena]|uniref:hypothetical protein n=1 Tax=Nodularia spumigena TaxID=70799 RepID=UPI00232EAE6D|nr:hypothetical protein [Nodularia spumigena]MDB9318252.1 hypothetical protein [Nodularia spumigena CS-590/01A]MDB9325012.1 hypothetical protein [Nodularia spumigena CS-590/02]MDB9336734.1 hypothetical protein [Nodularia spumigena CS-590/01]